MTSWSVAKREDGQASPVVLVAMTALAALAIVLVQGGRIGLFAARASTAADAAALAAAQAIADELEGVHGIGFLASGKVPAPVEAQAQAAAVAYANRNDARLVSFDVVEDGRRRVAVRVTTETLDQLGEPAATNEIRQYRAPGGAASELEVSFLGGPDDRGCLTAAEVEAIGTALVPPVDPVGGSWSNSGLATWCGPGGPDVRNLRPAMHEAVLRIEHVMGAPVQFTSGYRTYEEQLALYLDPFNPYPVAEPGTSWHHTGLAFDAGNHAAIANAISSGPPPQVQLCQPYPITDEVHFGHAEWAECGGPLPRPGNGSLRIETSDPRLIAQDDVS